MQQPLRWQEGGFRGSGPDTWMKTMGPSNCTLTKFQNGLENISTIHLYQSPLKSLSPPPLRSTLKTTEFNSFSRYSITKVGSDFLEVTTPPASGGESHACSRPTGETAQDHQHVMIQLLGGLCAYLQGSWRTRFRGDSRDGTTWCACAGFNMLVNYVQVM